MDFLCPNHRRHFAELPLEARKDLWLFWMENACALSERGQWQDVISSSGSAFDLACLHGSRDETCMHIELTLSAILVSRVLTGHGDHAGSERVLLRALQRLQACGHACGSEDGSGLKECITGLLDSSRRKAFFEVYLNWPALPFDLGSNSFAQVLH